MFGCDARSATGNKAEKKVRIVFIVVFLKCELLARVHDDDRARKRIERKARSRPTAVQYSWVLLELAAFRTGEVARLTNY